MKTKEEFIDILRKFRIKYPDIDVIEFRTSILDLFGVEI